MGFVTALNALVNFSIAAGRWLVLPLMALLFLQWPLRDLVRGHSREANDLGQIIFAIYVALSVTAATRAGTHLAADTIAQRYTPATRYWIAKLGAALGLLPWAAFIMIDSKSIVMPSLRQLESFQDTGNPGYFLIKLSLWIMAGSIVAQSVIDLLRPFEPDQT